MPDFKQKPKYLYDEEFGYFSRDDMAIVVAFDPGETTGYCVLGVYREVLTDRVTYPLSPYAYLGLADYGTIECASPEGLATGARLHAGLNIAGENRGITKMVDLVSRVYRHSFVIIEDFIPDMNRMDKARHTLSPVRLMAGFSYGFSLKDDVFGGSRTAEERILVQDRANPKTTCNDRRLRNWGLYDDHSGPHARDATRHAYYFLRKCAQQDQQGAELRHLAWPHLYGDPAFQAGLTGRAPKKIIRSKKVGERI